MRVSLVTLTSLIVLGLSTALIFLEIICRLLPVSTVRHSFNTNESIPIHTPNQEVIWARGPLLKGPVKSRINNAGFPSSINYYNDSKHSPIAAIGDSYIEALMLPEEKRVQSIINASLNSRAQVYTFAFSGAPLSQYVAYAKYAQKLFSPCAYIFFIVSNDFHESLSQYRKSIAFSYFDKNSTGYKLADGTAPNSFLRSIALESRFLTYLRAHLKIQRLWLHSPASHSIPFSDMKDSVDVFLAQIDKHINLSKTEILLVLDGDRQSVYNQSKDSQFRNIKNYLRKKNATYGFSIIDMDNIFKQHYLKNKKRFNFKDDYHWNALGHQIVAEAILQSGFIDKVLNHSR